MFTTSLSSSGRTRSRKSEFSPHFDRNYTTTSNVWKGRRLANKASSGIMEGTVRPSTDHIFAQGLISFEALIQASPTPSQHQTSTLYDFALFYILVPSSHGGRASFNELATRFTSLAILESGLVDYFQFNLSYIITTILALHYEHRPAAKLGQCREDSWVVKELLGIHRDSFRLLN